jgi:DNA processing protein
MAVPGPITSDLSAGCHQVIRGWQGTLVTSAAEVIEHLSPVGETAAGGPPAAEPGTVDSLANRREAPLALPRDLLDLESARVLDAMPGRGGMGTVRVAQRAGLAPAATATLLGQLATGGFVERCDDGWRLRRP